MGTICEIPSLQVPLGPSLLSEFTFFSHTISLYQGDLSEENVDAIVIMNDPLLKNAFSSTKNIINRGGEKIKDELNELRATVDHFDFGMAVYTVGGELYANYVFNVIVPDWNGFENDCEGILRECVENSLRLCGKLRINSISFPILSCKENNFPKNLCAETMVKTIKVYLEVEKEGGLIIRLISNENPNVRTFKNSLDKIFMGNMKLKTGGSSSELNNSGASLNNYRGMAIS